MSKTTSTTSTLFKRWADVLVDVLGMTFVTADIKVSTVSNGRNSTGNLENFKIRFFHTPLTISKIVKDPSAALCWRQCGKVGDYTHIFWDCPVILEYWKKY